MAPFRPLRRAGAAFVLALAACAPVSQVHLRRPASHPHAISKEQVRRFEVIERTGLRVLLRRGSERLKLSAPGGLLLADPRSGEELAAFEAGKKFQLSAEGGRLRAAGRLLGAREAELRPAVTGQKIKVGGLHYRGRLFFRAAGEKLLLVNELPLDQYLYGVLPSEVAPNWPMEALKAQAVAARTYALFRAGVAGGVSYDVDDSTRSQVYFGTLKEHARTSAAVDATTELVLAWRGAPAQAFFHANCGGSTADSREVWSADLPYLRGVEDPYCERGAHFAWRGEMDHDRVLAKLGAAGHKVADFTRLTPQDKDPSGRWRKVSLSGEGASLSLRASAFRAALGADLLRSSIFEAVRRGDTHHFEGRGWGHGVGLCQEGAEGMAKEGYRFKDILSFYFPGTRIRRLID